MNAHELDTIPPPPGGDAYGAATVVRVAPPEILASLRSLRHAGVTTLPSNAVALPRRNWFRIAELAFTTVFVVSVSVLTVTLTWLVLR